MTDPTRRAGFRARLRARETITATFQRTPYHELVEVLATSGLDAVCLDGEHSAFDRARLDVCTAMANALDFPVIVRVADARPAALLQALDCGADGVLVPHVRGPEEAAALVKAARFGPGGRGFAGITRSAGLGTRPMAEVLAEGGAPLVIAQIEDREAVERCEEICATPGLDAVFVGPGDLTVAYGHTAPGSPELNAAMARVGNAAARAGLACLTYVSDAGDAAALAGFGFTGWFIATDQAFLRMEAAAQVDRLSRALAP